MEISSILFAYLQFLFVPHRPIAITDFSFMPSSSWTFGDCLNYRSVVLKFYNTSLATCLRMCQRRPRCRSVSYIRALSYCELKDSQFWYRKFTKDPHCLHVDVRKNGLQLVSSFYNLFIKHLYESSYCNSY